MERKVIFILVDGMRRDALGAFDCAAYKDLKARGLCDIPARSVFPSITLPCHMSIFHSVPPERHNITSNTYVPMVRPVVSLIEWAHTHGKVCTMFYGWEQLRDISLPGHLRYSKFIRLEDYEGGTDEKLTEDLINTLPKHNPDFTFLYLGDTDHAGHSSGWMSDKYLETVNGAWECIRRVYDAFSDRYDIMITADHGGHDRMHGTTLDEDMNIALYAHFTGGEKLTGEASLLDIAPTVSQLLDIPCPTDWEGKSLL